MDEAHASPAEAAPVAAGFSLADVPRLTAALQRGNEAAFAWLHGAWSGRINRWCFALAAGDDSFAREIAQATWLRLMRHLRLLPDEQALWSWIACAARHAATDLRRKGGRYLRALRRFSESEPFSSFDAGDAAADGDDRMLAALEAALGKLTPDEQKLIENRYFAGESLETIGARQALSVRAVEGRLARLRSRLRQSIAQELKSQTL